MTHELLVGLMDEAVNYGMGRRCAVPLLAVTLLAACATPQPADVVPPVAVVPPPLAAAVKVDESAMLPLLGYLQLTAQFSAADLARERRTLAAIPQTPSTQVRQAMLLAQSQSRSSSRSSGDLARAIALLDNVQKANDAAAVSLRPLVVVLFAHYQERQRLLAQNDRLLAQTDRLQQQLTDSLQRAGELQQKLDALAEVETRLQARPGSGESAGTPARNAP